MKLHTDLGNYHSLKILISANLAGQNVELKVTKPDDKIVSYLQKVCFPVLESEGGVKIFSSNASSCLMFSLGDKTNLSCCSELLEWESSHLQPVSHAFLSSVLSSGKVDSNLLAPLKKQLKYLEDKIKDKTYMNKSDLTVGHAVTWAALYPLFSDFTPVADLRSEFSHLSQWFDFHLGNKAMKFAVNEIFPSNSKALLKTSILAMPAPPLPSGSGQKLKSQGSGAVAGEPRSQSLSSEPQEEKSPTVTPEEVEEAVKAWRDGVKSVPKPRARIHPILPQTGDKNILITSALPYVNNIPHLGNIIGCVLSADVFSRYCRLRNYNSLYICGTDEYGTATETKALEEGITPQQICDKYNQIHNDIYEWFNIDFDHFGRTTTEQQTEIAQDIFWKLYKKGFVLKDSVEQLQCLNCNRFLADRFVEGTCPLCAYEDARGDQCDKCGKLINAVDLKDPKCKVCGSKPVIKSSDHLFLDLPKLETRLVHYLEAEFEKGLWSHNTKVITRSWIRDGLKPRCISRDLKWGTPVPLEGFTDKVFYVWFDAPIGYLSITANYTDQWEKWWRDPEQVELYQFMAKDNIPFHSVIFPSCLLGTEDRWTVVNHLNATEYLNYEDGKFSKSRGVGVFGNNARDTGIPADIWRFYLLYLRPEGQDSAFSWDDFVLKNNSELLNNLGNFINRALMFVSNNFAGKVPDIELNSEDKELLALVTRELRSYIENLDKIKLRDGIRNILSISKLGNQYIQANKPWVLVKGSPAENARAGTVTGLAANIACLLAIMVQPYMPEVSRTIQTQLNAPTDSSIITDSFICFLQAGHPIGTPAPLFQKIEPSLAAELRMKYAGKPQPKAAAKASDPKEVERLTAAVAAQGDVVRKLKAEKAEKSQIDAEVTKLLELKKQLAAVQGTPPEGEKKVKKKGGATPQKKNGPNIAEPQPGTPKGNGLGSVASPQEIEELTQQVAKQGDLVRTLKTEKADKSRIDGEIVKLLALKKTLALAQGLNPEEAVSGGKKKKGKQKK